jgi:uncharacterized protein
MSDVAALAAHLQGMGRVLLGFSGGVDSALLGVLGAKALGPDRFLAVTGLSASLPEVQRFLAQELADRFGIPLLTLETHELADARYAANPANRCFYCKSELWSRCDEVARSSGFDTIMDGTNADDLREHRPGLGAAAEYGVRSPLAELGWTKAMVREAARALDIPVWNAPAAPCLASRIQYGLPVTPERLRQVETGEAFLRALGVSGNLRVRHHGADARLEVDPPHFAILDARHDEIGRFFRSLGFETVVRDPAGYRRGGLRQLTVA